jgi:hypothetical protein
MRFYPESTAPEYKAESDVWDVVKEALKNEDGVAWHGYRLYRKGRSYSYAPDIFVLSRRYGAIVIECKGCEINNIYAIHNTVWQMEDWYKPEITPVPQVENQKLEVQILLRKKLQHSEKLRFRVMVALPFIKYAEWIDRGFAEENAIEPVALAENLTVDGFLAWLDQHQHDSPQPPLTDGEWSAIVDALGGKQRDTTAPPKTIVPEDIPTTSSDLSRQAQVIFLNYEGEPPHDEVLRQHLGLPYLNAWKGTNPMPDYWYLVPTAGLEWKRRNLAPTIQVQERLRRKPNSRDEFGVKLLFRKALQHFMSLGPKPRIATRVSELVHLRRAMKFLELEPEMREQLRKDRYAWIEAFRDVEEQGLDLTVNPLEYEHLFVHPEVANLMGKMQAGFHQQLASQGELTFETAARAFLLSDDFQPPPLVIMEGFTRLTPLQLLFVESCLRIPECTLWFIRPFRAAQAEGFEAVEQTYRDLLILPNKKEIPEPLRGVRAPTTLVALQRSLFSEEEAVQAEREPESVIIEAYATRQREVAACVQHLKNYLDANPEYQIAVVTRDPLKYRTLLREEAALLDATFAERFDIPPVHLLLTPVGRFVLTLYNSWSGGRLVLSVEQFRHILASGWLGRRAKNSVPLFQSIAPAFFARCENSDSWQKAFAALEVAINKSAGKRTLAALCTSDDAALWRKTMEIVLSLAQQLFDGQLRNLDRQIERLQSTLETLDLQDVQEDEREVIQRIIAVLQNFTDSSDLELDGEEVGEVLNSLIRQREDIENHDRITVTGPESLDGLQKDIVYYLGVDEHRVPRATGDNWPLAETDITENQLQERYLFLATIRAATKHLHLTYAEIDDRQACGPSLYLDEVMRTLGRGQVPLADRPADGEHERVEAPIEAIGLVRRNAYIVSELAQFQVCPRRYHLQRITHTANYYRDSWQVLFLIQGILLTYALEDFQSRHPTGVAVEELPNILAGSALSSAVERAKEIYTGYTKEDWFFLAQQTRRKILDDFAWMKESWAERTVHVARRQDTSLPLHGANNRTINIHAATRFIIYGILGNSTWRYVYTGDLLAEEWLLPARKDETEHSRYLAIQWWRELTQNFVKKPHDVKIGNSIQVKTVQQKLASLEEMITHVEQGMYQARPGEQCRYCPVQSLCLGRQTGGLL